VSRRTTRAVAQPTTDNKAATAGAQRHGVSRSFQLPPLLLVAEVVVVEPLDEVRRHFGDADSMVDHELGEIRAVNEEIFFSMCFT